jgi:hypothetical protein
MQERRATVRAAQRCPGMVSGTTRDGRFEFSVSATVADPVDVVVAGGGTAGAVAAIAAARAGARVLLVEARGYLGGMMTAGNAGLTTYIVHEKDESCRAALMADLREHPEAVHVAGGIPMEITRRLAASGAAALTSGQPGAYVFASQGDFKVLLVEMAREAGVRFLLHTAVVDVHREGKRVLGALVHNKSGIELVPAAQFVDATGDGDLAALAGVPFFKGVGPEDQVYLENMGTLGAMGQMGIMFRMGGVDTGKLFAHLRGKPEAFQVQRVAGQSIEEAWKAARRGDMACFVVKVRGLGGVQLYNSPIPGVYTVCCPCFEGDGTSARDLSAGEIGLAVEARRYASRLREAAPGFERALILDLPEIGVRETRHIRGDYLLTLKDILLMTRFPDSIGRGSHPVDTKPVPSYLKDADLPSRFHFHIPYRCLLASEVDNLLLAGRCVSCTHEASGCMRVTVQCMVTGQAAGTAAALAASRGSDPRELPVEELRRRLEADGVLL